MNPLRQLARQFFEKLNDELWARRFVAPDGLQAVLQKPVPPVLKGSRGDGFEGFRPASSSQAVWGRPAAAISGQSARSPVAVFQDGFESAPRPLVNLSGVSPLVPHVPAAAVASGATGFSVSLDDLPFSTHA